MIAAVIFVWVKAAKGRAKATVLMIVLACGMLLFAPAAFWDEMSTIRDGAQDSTGGARVYLWKIAVRQFVDNPLMGVGALNYGVWLPEYVRDDDVMSDGTQLQGLTTRYGRVCHSLYFTLLSELGLLGVALFGMMFYCFFKSMKFVTSSSKDLVAEEQARTSPEDLETGNKCRLLGLGLSGSMIGFLVSAAFLSVLYYPQFWLLCSLGVSLRNCLRSEKR
jgi:O-antigen ligase